MGVEFDMDLEITELLKEWAGGDLQAGRHLIGAVYHELRRISRTELKREFGDHTLQTTELINEVYIRFMNQKVINAKNRNQFFAIASKLMRQILVEHMRKRKALKRKGNLYLVSTPIENQAHSQSYDLVRLDEALRHLARIDSRKAKLVELRFFTGLTQKEIAEILGVSPTTVKRDWKIARAWLYQQLNSRRETKPESSTSESEKVE